MNIRFYIDSETQLPHIQSHDVEEHEVIEAFESLLEDGGGEEGIRVGIGRTDAGRFIRVIYSPDPEPDSVLRNYCL